MQPRESLDSDDFLHSITPKNACPCERRTGRLHENVGPVTSLLKNSIIHHPPCSEPRLCQFLRLDEIPTFMSCELILHSVIVSQPVMICFSSHLTLSAPNPCHHHEHCNPTASRHDESCEPRRCKLCGCRRLRYLLAVAIEWAYLILEGAEICRSVS